RREALRIACAMAGLDDAGQPRPGEVWRPPPRRPEPAPEPLAEAELEARMRAVRLASLHYSYLAELEEVPTGERRRHPTALEHIDFLAELGAFDPRRVRIGDACRRQVA